MRAIFGILTGLIAAVLIIFMAQMIREGLYPQPSRIGSIDEIKLWMSTLPTNAFLIVAVSHALAAFAGGLIPSLVAGKARTSSGVVALSIIFIMVMLYLFSYSFPVWFVVTDTALTAIFGFLGVIMGSRSHLGG